MNYLARVELKNFQSLADTSINLAPGLTCIVGPSNLGKSAAVRAIKTLVKNASAPGLVREGEKEFTLTALFKDGDTIDLTKGKSKSEYRVNGELFAKAGATSVPQAVAEIWQINDPDLTFASQHDTPFLLDVPASQVAHTLGELTNASVLMEAVQRANKLRTQANADEKARTREAEEAREELLTHTGLTTRTEAIKAVRQAYEAASELTQKWHTLSLLEREYQELIPKLSEITIVDTSVLQIQLSATESAVHSLLELEQIEQEHLALLDKLNDCNVILEDTQMRIDTKLEQIHELVGDTCPLCEQRIEH
jgi:DNA repair protein SbcC/Rad50